MKSHKNVEARMRFRGLTVMKRGRLSKVDIADPRQGLEMKLKIEQAEPVKVQLVATGELDIEDAVSYKRQKEGHDKT